MEEISQKKQVSMLALLSQFRSSTQLSAGGGAFLCDGGALEAARSWASRYVSFDGAGFAWVLKRISSCLEHGSLSFKSLTGLTPIWMHGSVMAGLRFSKDSLPFASPSKKAHWLAVQAWLDGEVTNRFLAFELLQLQAAGLVTALRLS